MRFLRKKTITLEDQVRSILQHHGPVLAKRIPAEDLHPVIDEVRKRVKNTDLAFLAELRAYDFKHTPYLWVDGDGIRNYELARHATHVLVQLLMEENDWDFITLVTRINQPLFQATKINRFNTTLCGMLNSIYRSTHSAAIIDLVMNDDRYADYRDVQPYDFTKTRNIWKARDGTKNYALARKATHAHIQKLMHDKDWTFPELVKNIDYTTFATTPINRYGTTLRGMDLIVYDRSPGRAILDLVMNDDRYADYRDLQLYDFGRMPHIWNRKDGTKDYALARTATEAHVEYLLQQNSWDFPGYLTNIGQVLFRTHPINRYGAKLAGMAVAVYDSHADAILDWMRNHPGQLARQHREQYSWLTKDFFMLSKEERAKQLQSFAA